MKTHKIRFGFACNSSSVSSLILVDPGLKYDSCEKWIEVKDKREFFARVMFWQIRDGKDEENTVFVNRVCGTELNTEQLNEYVGSYLTSDRGPGDTFSFPTDRKGNIHEEFAKEFLEYVDKKDLSWLSYDDNYKEDAYDLISMHASMGVSLLQYFPHGVARKDENYWTIFSQKTGNKIRLSFDYSQVAPEKSTIPELIDIKLTNYCPYECEFCYQGSDKKGNHADKEAFKSIIDQLYKYDVFEIALGGGEPTLHPDFNELIDYINEKNIVVNITTRNWNWIKSYIDSCLEGMADNYTFYPKIKSVAISTETPDMINKVYEYTLLGMEQKLKGKMVNYERLNECIQFQYIVGINDKLEEMLETCFQKKYRLTLLGYKTTNRGSLLKPKAQEWRSIVKKYLWMRSYIGIDTVLAKDCEGLLDTSLEKLLLEKHEGRFSCYIDAVNYKIGPSSFCATEEMMPFTDLKENFKVITDKS